MSGAPSGPLANRGGTCAAGGDPLPSGCPPMVRLARRIASRPEERLKPQVVAHQIPVIVAGLTGNQGLISELLSSSTPSPPGTLRSSVGDRPSDYRLPT